MDFEAVKKVVRSGSSSGNILAEVIVSTYWHNKRTSLFLLTNLESNSRKLAFEIMEYRLSQDWDDHQFYMLALYAQDVIMPPLLPPIKRLIIKKQSNECRLFKIK